MIYLNEIYKGHTISFRKGNTGDNGKSIVSFKIKVAQGDRKACGCFWCQGMWWKDEDYARIAAQTWIDEQKWYPDTGFVGKNSPRRRRNLLITPTKSIKYSYGSPKKRRPRTLERQIVQFNKKLTNK